MKYKALLIDFDNTLVLFNEDKFLASYAKLAYPYFKDLFDTSTFFQKILASTLNMLNNDGRMTNAEVFSRDFIKDVPQLSFDECNSRFEQFYLKSFSQLGKEVTAIPQGRHLIKRVLDEGMQVVIATNPIFPEIASRHRLEWANLADLEITLLTHAQNMSYCKPYPEYYRQILSLLHRQPEECLMAGNDPVSDMAASDLGIATFLVNLDQEKGRLGIISKQIGRSTNEKTTQSKFQIDGQGSLKELEQFILT